MSDFLISNGLINVGGILTETKTRRTRASAPAKTALGLDPNREYLSSIGVAQISEYITARSGKILKDANANLTLPDVEQPVRISHFYPSQPQADYFRITVINENNALSYMATFKRNFLNFTMPKLVIMPGSQVIISALEQDIQDFTIVYEVIDVIFNHTIA
jgi:hypothetical protein